MQKEQIELINNLADIEKDQRHLLSKTSTPQQAFLHLFAHRHLASQFIFSQHLQKVALEQLPGSFAQQALQLLYQSICINNHIILDSDKWGLKALIEDWVNYYPTVRNHQQILLCDIVTQEQTFDIFEGYGEYVAYLDLIAVDLWKILRRGRKQAEFTAKRGFKQHLQQIKQNNLSRLDVGDLLSFVEGCLPNTLFNVVLEDESRPSELRSQRRVECLFSNQQTEFYLRSSSQLSLLLKQIMIILLTVDLSHSQQAQLMRLTLNYYITYMPIPILMSKQILASCFNKIDSTVANQLSKQMLLFLRMMIKLEETQLLTFLQTSSVYFKKLLETVRKSAVVGCTQQMSNPFNHFQLAQSITINPGKSQCRYFEVIDAWSLLYFRVNVPAQDITIRFHYLGSIEGAKESRRVVLNLQKLGGEIKDSVNLVKPGLYMIEFDNSYSWMSGKTISFERVVLTPLEIQFKDAYAWNYDFYNNIIQNEIPSDDKIKWLTLQLQPQLKKSETNSAGAGKSNKKGTADLSQRDDVLTMVVINQEGKHTYETDSRVRMEQVARQLFESNSSVKWTICQKPTKGLLSIEEYIRNSKKPDATEATQAAEEADDEDIEYEVVRREKGGVSREQKVEKRSKKDEISWSSEEMEECYGG